MASPFTDQNRCAAGIIEGLAYVVIANPKLASRLGYVAIPSNHHGYWASEEAIQSLDVHGGVTYDQRDDRFRVVGFDCLHWKDQADHRIASKNLIELWSAMLLASKPVGEWPHLFLGHEDKGEVRDTAYCVAECARLIEGINAL